MPQRKRSLLFVSPTGSSVKTMRVSVRVVVVVCALAAVGIAGFFLPLDLFTLTEQEQEQKRTLEVQNAGLRQNISATLQTLSGLSERFSRLQENKDRHRDIIGLPTTRRRGTQVATQTGVLPDAAAARIRESEEFISLFTDKVIGGGVSSIFDTIPINRPISPSASVLSRRFGMDRDPFTGKQKMHYGTDFAAPVGTPVVATASGVVSRLENDHVWGRRVTINHGRDFRTVYAHLGTVNVTLGKRVTRGEVIGTVGRSGLTTGTHVHYEIWQGDRQIDPEVLILPDVLSSNFK